MTITTPKRGLPKAEGTDNARDYLKGTIAGGGLHEALDILDDMITEGIVDAKGDLLAGTAADTIGRVPIGANGTLLTADSAQAAGMAWVTPAASGAIPTTLVDAKGDLIAATAADTVARVPVGANGTVLTADSGAAGGVSWGTGPATALAAHVADSDPHVGYVLDAGLTAAVAAHEGAADPHTGYLLESARPVVFANAGDAGKKLQSGTSVHTFASSNFKSTAVTFPTAFGSTPNVVASCGPDASLTGYAQCVTTGIGTTGVTITLTVSDILPGGSGGTASSFTLAASWIGVG